MDIDLDELFPNEEGTISLEVIDADLGEVGNDGELSVEVLNAAALAKGETLPGKSRGKYYKVLECFEKWRTENKVTVVTEDVLLAYFHQLSEKFKPSSLWSYYSMLKGTIRTTFGVDIAKYYELKAFLKQKNKGYKPVKAKAFTEQEVARFVSTALDKEWLDVKAICIFGLCGALRCDEIVHITLRDIEHRDGVLIVHIRETKTSVPRTFAINGAFYNVVQKYSALRQPTTKTDRFFVNFVNGKCTVQPIGKNKISLMPRRIAVFLSLPESDRYTGHAFRRTSATVYANAGGTTDSLKRFVKWKNTSVAESYVAESFHFQKKTGETITAAIVKNMENSVTSDDQQQSRPIDALAVEPPGVQRNELISQTHVVHTVSEGGTDSSLSLIQTQGTVSMIQTKEAVTVDAAKDVHSAVKKDDTVSAESIDPLTSESIEKFLRNGRVNFQSLSGCNFNIHFK